MPSSKHQTYTPPHKRLPTVITLPKPKPKNTPKEEIRPDSPYSDNSRPSSPESKEQTSKPRLKLSTQFLNEIKQELDNRKKVLKQRPQKPLTTKFDDSDLKKMLKVMVEKIKSFSDDDKEAIPALKHFFNVFSLNFKSISLAATSATEIFFDYLSAMSLLFEHQILDEKGLEHGLIYTNTSETRRTLNCHSLFEASNHLSPVILCGKYQDYLNENYLRLVAITDGLESLTKQTEYKKEECAPIIEDFTTLKTSIETLQKNLRPITTLNQNEIVTLFSEAGVLLYDHSFKLINEPTPTNRKQKNKLETLEKTINDTVHHVEQMLINFDELGKNHQDSMAMPRVP